MVERKAFRGDREFFGCPNYPRCTQSFDVDENDGEDYPERE